MTQTPAPLKRTPLRDVHVKAGAKMVPFGGWDMPVQYTGIIEEHRCVRSAVGLFDISHMGEFEVRGPGALGAVQRVTSNDASTLATGQVQYSLLCYPEGGIVDDLTLYRLADQHYMLAVNASHIDKGGVAGVPCVISRTGYTGEDGLELYAPAERLEGLWNALMEGGKGDGIQPIGLGARDTLRLKMKFALYGNDIDETTSPLEAGLGWVVKPAKGDFIGRAAIEKVRAAGVTRRLVGFEMAERAVARHGYRMSKDGAEVGVVTSGSFSPSLERCIGMGYLRADLAPAGTELDVDIRGQAHRARVAKTPFVPSKAKKS